MKTVLVVGGARGIGREMVIHLAREGWQVAFSYHHSREQARDLAQATKALAFRADITKETEAQALGQWAIHTLGHLDAAVFNAGISFSALAQDTDATDWDFVFNTNLKGHFLVSRPLIRHMVGRQQGSLLFISSMWGLRGASYESAYASSKAGLLAYATSLAQELGPSGIRVNSLAPGAIDTEMLGEYSTEEKNALAERSLLKRLGQPGEVAAAAAFLLSERANYITGQCLGVDGGFI